MSRRALAWLLAAMVGAGAFLYGAVDEGGPRTNDDRVYAIAKTIGCPVCSGQSVAESDATVAKNIRLAIAVWVQDGRSDEEIRSDLRSRFGDDVDYTPSADGITSLVWILPVVAGAGAAAGLVVVFRKWKREGDLEASAADAALVEDALAARDDV
ncbi:MAG: cytochrome c-type biogenesis protein CcmH [Acidimicrobiales bacterium]|nr:cytochrome c-type biogenesis protein CcmH [Acidimicrobiales bacterium]